MTENDGWQMENDGKMMETPSTAQLWHALASGGKSASLVKLRVSDLKIDSKIKQHLIMDAHITYNLR